MVPGQPSLVGLTGARATSASWPAHMHRNRTLTVQNFFDIAFADADLGGDDTRRE